MKGDAAELRILYGLRDESSTEPRTHDAPGWNGIGPVVTGNRASDQLQLGVYGDLLSVALAYARPATADVAARSRHALDLDGLRRPNVRLWTATDAGTIVGRWGWRPSSPAMRS